MATFSQFFYAFPISEVDTRRDGQTPKQGKMEPRKSNSAFAVGRLSFATVLSVQFILAAQEDLFPRNCLMDLTVDAVGLIDTGLMELSGGVRRASAKWRRRNK